MVGLKGASSNSSSLIKVLILSVFLPFRGSAKVRKDPWPGPISVFEVNFRSLWELDAASASI
jgi:hypothetical protein